MRTHEGHRATAASILQHPPIPIHTIAASPRGLAWPTTPARGSAVPQHATRRPHGTPAQAVSGVAAWDAEAWVLVHIAVSSGQEADCARRVLTYHYGLLDRYDHPVVSLAILGDERPSGRPQQDRRTRWGCTLTWPSPIVKLLG